MKIVYCVIYIYENNRAVTKYVGFAQYDMYFPPKSIQNILDKINSNKSKEFFFSAELQNYETCFFYTWNDFTFINNFYIFEGLKKGYEIFRNTKIDKNRNFPLLNTFVIPSRIYCEIMPLVIHLYHYFMQKNLFIQGKNFEHLAGIFERIMAFILGQENNEFILFQINHKDLN